MSLTAKQGPSIQQIETGNHHGICVSIIDLGTQYNETFGKEQPKILITWELPDFPFVNENGEPDPEKGFRLISKEYTVSLNDKSNLYADLVSWRGRAFTDDELQAFNLRTILGANCLVNVIHNAKGYANVAAVAKLPKSMTAKNGTYQLIYDMDEGVADIPEGVPDWVKDKIKRSREYVALEDGQGEQQAAPIDDSDIPF